MYEFQRSKRLRQHSLIAQLFQEGKSFYAHPFKVFYLKVDPAIIPTCQVVLSVSRKNFKRAVDRNRIRRQMREAYRHHQHILLGKPELVQSPIVFGILYTGKDLPEFIVVRDKIMSILKRLSGDYEKPTG